jgi:uncharacterized protein YyaL (SSP411 family)
LSAPPSNRLKNSASAYLRSAAHQPIHWYEWGDEVFARARSEDKPILLDIGAVWCHWCHVIDRESYENPEIAAIINQNFVAVKVDRDERPDVDARYQAAVSALSGQGGWPLTGFLTPDGRPFFGGTYFPSDDAMGRPGFRRILLAIAESYRTRRAEVNQSAESLAEAVGQAELFSGARAAFDPRIADKMTDAIVRMFDLRNGGFGRAPKFPHPGALDLVAERFAATGEKHLLTVLDSTLAKMAQGGVYDQLAGGFHRYSVDERWRVPHFEKMAYDNSQLLANYVHGYQVTGNSFYREVAEGIIGWVDATLSDRSRGGFYTSQDADYSLEDDGDYFTWTLEEARAVLDADEARVAELNYDIGVQGEMHHNPAKNVLFIATEIPGIAERLGKPHEAVRGLLASAQKKMLAARMARPTPYIDTTVYTSWNALFVSAYLDAARVLGRNDCRDFALRTLDRVLAEAWDAAKGFAHRIGPDGSPRLDGVLDDQVFTAAALLDAFEATLDRGYFDAAVRAVEVTLKEFSDAEGGGFFDRGATAAPMGGLDVRRKPLQDSPTPSGNAVAAIVLDRLHGFTGDARYRERAQATLEAFAGVVPQYGLFAASYALAAILHARHAIQVVVLGQTGDARADRLEKAAHGVFRFGKAVLRVTPELLAEKALPAALAEMLPHLNAETAQALVCMGSTCQSPTSDMEQLAALLKAVPASVAAR